MTADGRPRRPLKVESLDHEGKGVAHEDGKVVFIEGALPGETAHIRVTHSRTSFDVAVADRIEHPSSQRVTPQCPHFGVCGGCSLQHLDARAQVAAKQRVLEDNLARIGSVRPEMMLAAIHGPSWGYRYRARLSVRDVQKKGGVLVGFRERKSTFVVDMSECHVLPTRWSERLVPLRRLVEGLSIRDRMPQIEIACGESVDAMVLRILAPLTVADEALVRTFADRWQVCIYLQSKGPETIGRFHPMDAPELDYILPEFDLRFPFGPSEFTQVNHAVNRVLVSRAIRLLDPRPGERVADMFCGLGNFSLPIARRGATVVGYEGSEALVRRARETAAVNGLSDTTTFEARDLFKITPEQFAALGAFDKMMIDPPRDGAVELVKSLAAALPKRIVYVSCAPGTLARDAGVLVNVHGYRLRAAGVVNMFPHTAHVESIAVFDR